ncbi:MAG: hypothetical protein QMC36_02670 [Patescibacteria group bacterium]
MSEKKTHHSVKTFAPDARVDRTWDEKFHVEAPFPDVPVRTF